MADSHLRVFPGGGRATILDPGGPARPALIEVEWPRPSTERVQATREFWELVHGHLEAFWFEFAGTRYEPCHFEADSLKLNAAGGDRLVVRFWGVRAPKQGE